MNNNHYRQGDVLILALRMPHLATKLTPAPLENSRIVLAHGEVTGHAHAIAVDPDTPTALIYGTDPDTDRFLDVLDTAGVSLTHEEHDTIHLPHGQYVVRIQREYVPSEGSIRVAD
jgi:hypothetical protein